MYRRFIGEGTISDCPERCLDLRQKLSRPSLFDNPNGLRVYQRQRISADTWTWECRPIIDKKLGCWYGSFNPTIDRALRGADAGRGFEFSPNFKLSYDVSPRIATVFDPLREQQQQILPAIDLNLKPKWEFNFGVGIGVTHGTDHLPVKTILGYRLKL